MAHDPEVIYHIKRCELATNKNVVDAKKDLETFMEKSLKWCGEIKSLLKTELIRVGNSHKKRDHIIPPVMPLKSHERVTQGTSATVNNVINIGEAHIHIGNESISCRTRGALKALQSSILTGSNTGNRKESQNTRGRSRIRRTKQEDAVVTKRTAEEDTLGNDIISKKIKKEKLSMVETPKKSEEVFKKPKPRTRKLKQSKKSESMKDVTNELAVEESITFDAVLHSSPNGNPRENTFLVSPKNLSVIPKSEAPVRNLSPKEEVDFPIPPSSTSSDFISDGEGEAAKLGTTYITGVNVGQNQNKKSRKRETDRNSKALGNNLDDIQKNNSSKSDIVMNGETSKRIELENVELKHPSISIKNELINNTNNGRESEKKDAKLVEETEKRVEGENEIIIGKETMTSDGSNTVKPMEAKEVSERRSNVENEPEIKKTKRTKAKKTEKVVSDAGEPVRITRTKSKEARQAMEEAAMSKVGLIEFARKSLNKAKLISLQKDQPKIKQPLANRLAYQKRQISLSKLPTLQKDDNLESSNKINALPLKNAIVNFGSQVKMSKVQYLKSNENLLLTGKGKYQNLFSETKNKYITPGKRCLSPDVAALKSTSKTTREEEIEKDLKLKALKEKEEEALMKREMAIKMRQKELKEKNEKKLELATKQRKKLEMEKYNCKIQLEKEKEEKRKLLLQEREMIKKEKARLKKELMEQKLAETEERRRLEEEARIAKLREQEAEQQRIMLEKQKELERHEKRAQERLAEQKAWENYEMKLKTEQMLREKQQLLAAQLQSANKAGTGKGNMVKQWNYKPRNENDFGLDDEDSDLDSENEGANEEKARPVPKWAQRVMSRETVVKCLVKKQAMMEYMKCHQKTPDIQKMFKMTPTKRIKRTSSAIWNTPSS